MDIGINKQDVSSAVDAGCETRTLSLVAPMTGVLVDLGDCPDPVFAFKMAGDGVAIDPVGDLVVAPCDATITVLPGTHHALTLKTDTGVEVLIHIGLDTGVLRGNGFEALAKQGERVQQGQPLVRVDREVVAAKATSLQSVMLITSGEAFSAINAGVELVAGETPVITLGVTTKQGDSENPAISASASGDASAELVVRNPHGLHARPISNLIKIIRGFRSDVILKNLTTGKEGKANSLTGLLSLELGLGVPVQVIVNGPDADVALAAIVQGFENGLGEKLVEIPVETVVATVAADVVSTEDCDIDDNEPPLLGLVSLDDNTLSGVRAAPGLAIGQLVYQRRELPEFPELAASAHDEFQALDIAIQAANAALESLVASVAADGMASHAEVFAAHQQLLEDPSIREQAEQLIDQGKSAAFAWHAGYQAEATALKTLDNPLLAARAADVEDIGLRVLRLLLNIEEEAACLPENAILVMDDLTPSEVIMLDRSRVAGICTLKGGATSHAAILCGSMGIPYLVSVSEDICRHASGTPAILDAVKAQIRLNPSEEDLARSENKRKFAAEHREAALALAHQPAITNDGHRVEVVANIGSADDAVKAVEMGAEGVGLLRSEFLYMERTEEPSVAEQARVYEQILNIMGHERPVIVRTMDVGGDKPLAYLPLPQEENPFLGERGVRIGINRPAILRKQVRAILRAAGAGHVRIMFPMISSLNEIQVVKKLVHEEQARLGIEKVELGIMIEVPSAALMADLLAKEVDFFSIGTNDLTQYTLAVDRGHPKLTAMVDGLHPAVLRLIDMTVKAAEREGKWVGVCGGLASDLEAVPVLVGLGIHELSASVPIIPEVKARVRGLNRYECSQLAEAALEQSSAEAVRKLVRLA
ncbi:phosphoenolpyruvate--protein phosphotransferase [Parendozoicomonas haliclonae]|uniref:phosphoenolpyruvate--protein phosphotransferase n=1 Tax=Parendozoicomonas haliclonae TaxID=1960125 RepID=A0A1X7ANQ2_9GAMM|nr:phosphoenolpyruvate--protein phosphotransferase [Parendozoicomonas haliclonae]SMA49916.1 Phosphoenolpyruvate-protein phosphotransferase [Parendozoicomonas haliclonae]